VNCGADGGHIRRRRLFGTPYDDGIRKMQHVDKDYTEKNGDVSSGKKQF
jgi:hypothetical protein